MNIINSIIVAGIIGLAVSCDTDEKNNCLDVSNSVIISWRNDSLGCHGERRKLIESNDINPKDYIGKNIECIYKILGRPNYKYEMEGSTEIYYYVSCAIAPPAYGTDRIRYDRINTEATKMYVEYSIDGMVKRVHCTVP